MFCTVLLESLTTLTSLAVVRAEFKASCFRMPAEVRSMLAMLLIAGQAHIHYLDSTTNCDTVEGFHKHLMRRFKSQSLARPVIDCVDNHIELVLSHT